MWQRLHSLKFEPQLRFRDRDRDHYDASEPRRRERETQTHDSAILQPSHLKVAQGKARPFAKRNLTVQIPKSETFLSSHPRNPKRRPSCTPECHKPSSSGRPSKPRPQLPARIFKKLPREVYDCILTQLEEIHLNHGQACSSCYLKSLYNLSLTSRAWYKLAAAFMYGKVLVFTNEERTELPKIWAKGTSRLKLLRRTLRNRDALARNVRELHLSGFQALYQKASMDREEIVNLVASLVMACPNLERLVGFNIPYQDCFDRFSHALSTRPKLKERVWVLGDKDTTLSDEGDDDLGNYYSAACDPTERFLDLNAKHPLLTALVFHQEPGQDSAPLNFRSIIGTAHQYPALRHLSISGLNGTSFPNLALSALPPDIQSLRLENLAGVNDKGLQRFVASQLATSIEKLTLINLNITSLTTLSAILSPHLPNLKHFSFVQYQAPDQSSNTTRMGFCSPSLQYIHWEIRSQADLSSTLLSRPIPSAPNSLGLSITNSGPKCCLATSMLASGIETGALPSLCQIRIPFDPQGVIQALCRPLGSALLPSDASFLQASSRLRGPSEFQIMPDYNSSSSPVMQGFPMSLPLLSQRADSVISSPISTKSSGWELLTPMRSRLAAHARILAAKKEPFIMFRIYDAEGALRLERCSAGFVGKIGSKISYLLREDKNKGTSVSRDDDFDSSEWIAATEELLGVGESEGTGSEQKWKNCGHPYGGKVSRNMASIEDVF